MDYFNQNNWRQVLASEGLEDILSNEEEPMIAATDIVEDEEDVKALKKAKQEIEEEERAELNEESLNEAQDQGESVVAAEVIDGNTVDDYMLRFLMREAALL